MKRIFFTLCILAMSIANAQEAKESINKGDINDKFNYVINESNNYQNYKVIKKDWLTLLKRQVIDSIQQHKNTTSTLQKNIDEQKTQINKLTEEVSTLKENITKINTDKDHISFMSMTLKKGDFKTMFWTIVAILTALLVFFIYRFRNSNSITKVTRQQLADLEKEYESHRKVALEREQKVMRKLQDELNKNKS